MNKRIRALAEQAEDWADSQNFYESDYRDYLMAKFADLIVQECIQTALNKRHTEQELDALDDIKDRWHLMGNNSGIIDAVVAIRQKFQI